MIAILRARSTHADRLERWLGADAVQHLSSAMRGWYGPPIAVAGVPGAVWACGDGDFRGPILSGRMTSAIDLWVSRYRRAIRRQMSQANMGFSSLSDLVAEATAGKRNVFAFNKIGTTGVVGVTNSLWRVGPSPAAGAAASVAPGGIAPTKSTTGTFNFAALGADTMHFTVGMPFASVGPNTLLLYDRIFAVAKTMNSTATEAVTGVPTRYQNTTIGAVDSAEGNFLFVEVGTALAATAHNWTVCLYTDQGGTGSNSLPSLTGNASAIANRLDHPAQQWYAPLASGDWGIHQLDQMQCSALVASGTIDFVIGHPIAFMPCPLANFLCVTDGINTAFNLVRIFEDAALALLEVTKPATTATTYTGQFEACFG